MMITFFGASVTLQRNGYARILSEMFEDETKVFGYGGMHLNNAGICYIDDVLASKPDYCFIDFFSTVYTVEDKNTIDYLNTIVYKFTKAKCKLIFLFFPKHYNELNKWYNYCKEYLNNKNISYIDLNEKLSEVDNNTILKDIVHTNQKGSQLYADLIFEEFNKIKNDIKLIDNIKDTKYCDIKKLIVNKQFSEKVIFKGNAKVIGIVNTIGPFTGVVEIKTKDKIQKISMWDRWCYYTREHFNLAFIVDGTTEITVLDDNFDTETCKYSVNFQKTKKKLIFHTVFYIGDDLTIKNFEDSKTINNIELSYLNIRGRIIQLLAKYKIMGSK